MSGTQNTQKCAFVDIIASDYASCIRTKMRCLFHLGREWKRCFYYKSNEEMENKDNIPIIKESDLKVIETVEKRYPCENCIYWKTRYGSLCFVRLDMKPDKNRKCIYFFARDGKAWWQFNEVKR